MSIEELLREVEELKTSLDELYEKYELLEEENKRLQDRLSQIHYMEEKPNKNFYVPNIYKEEIV